MPNRTAAPVSVVIPCYRCSDTVARAVASVFAQTWRPAELLLVDDHSGDDTLSRLRALEGEYAAGWIQVLQLPENGGPGTARNAGWEQASQPYVAFLDADDAWHPKKIEIQLGWMLEHPEASLTGHSCQVVRGAVEETASQELIGSVAFSKTRRPQLLLSNRFPTPSVILKRHLPHRFAPGKRHSEDYLLWCEICLDGHPCYRIAEPLAFLHKAAYGEGGLSADLSKMQRGEMDTYHRLEKSGRINRIAKWALLVWSILKYQRRMLFTKARRESCV